MVTDFALVTGIANVRTSGISQYIAEQQKFSRYRIAGMVTNLMWIKVELKKQSLKRQDY